MPDPEGPIKPNVSPRVTCNEIPFNMSTAPALPFSDNRASVRSITGSLMALVFHWAALWAYGAAQGLRKLCAASLVAICLTGAVRAETVTITALGDSLTQGFGVFPGKGFVPQMQAWLTAQGADVDLQNAGVSGDTTRGGLARLDWVLGPEVDALIVNLGGNDVLRGLDPAHVKANLAAILQRAADDGLPVLLVGLRAPKNYGAAYKTAFDTIYPDLAEQFGTLHIGNYFEPLGMADGRVNPDLMQADGIHPNAKGVTELVAAMGPVVLQLIARID